MTASELRAVQEALGLSDEALAAALALTPGIVRAWREGSLAVPARYARQLRWRATVVEQQAAPASGLPTCPWVQTWEEQPVPDGLEEMRSHFEALDAHGDSCATCAAHARYLEERAGPLPPGLLRVARLLAHIPSWARPTAVGAAILGVIVSLRLLLALPVLVSQPGKVAEALLALGTGMGAGAAGGAAYSITRPALRRLGRPGEYLTGIVCASAYMGALVVAAPVAFGEPLIKDGWGVVAVALMSVLFGLVIGHSWFRKDALG